MKAFQTGIIPVRFRDAGLLAAFKTHCLECGLLHPYEAYGGCLNLKSIRDISTEAYDLFFLKADDNIDIQCAFCGDSVLLIVTSIQDFSDYYLFITSALKNRSKFVKDILSFQSKDEQLTHFLSLVKESPYQVRINYVFTFFGIFDPRFSDAKAIHAKILAEPSIINLDDMLSSDVSQVVYNKGSEIDESIADSVEDIDLNGSQWTFVTWASLVTVARKEMQAVQNHLVAILLELRTQYIWNLSYDQGMVIDNLLAAKKPHTAGTTKIVADSYHILLEAKSFASATLSSRFSRLNKAIIQTSQLSDITGTLDQKLNYLIVFADMAGKEEVKRASTVSEVLLFLVALAQVFPLFFDMPLSGTKVLGYITIPLLSVLGIWLIFKKFRRNLS